MEGLESLSQRRQAVAGAAPRAPSPAPGPGDRSPAATRPEAAAGPPDPPCPPPDRPGRSGPMNGLRGRLAGGVHQLQAVRRRFHRTVEEVLPLVCWRLIRQIGTVEPDHRQPSRAVLDAAADEREAPPARTDAPQPREPPAEGLGAAGGRLGDRPRAAPVLVAKGEMEDQVADRPQARPGEGLSARGAHAADRPERSVGIQTSLSRSQAPSKRRTTTPQRSSSPGLISPGTPVSIRPPLRKVLFIVPISSPKKNLLPRR